MSENIADGIDSHMQALEALECAAGALWDALGEDEGLDSRAGEAVLGMIDAALVANGRPSMHKPQCDADTAWFTRYLEERLVALRGPSTLASPPQTAEQWFREHDFVKSGELWCIAFDTRSGYDFTDLEFYPLRRRVNDQGWDAIIGHHASGTNPRLIIGTCETLADIQLVYDTIKHINGYPGTPDRLTSALLNNETHPGSPVSSPQEKP